MSLGRVHKSLLIKRHPFHLYESEAFLRTLNADQIYFLKVIILQNLKGMACRYFLLNIRFQCPTAFLNEAHNGKGLIDKICVCSLFSNGGKPKKPKVIELVIEYIL